MLPLSAALLVLAVSAAAQPQSKDAAVPDKTFPGLVSLAEDLLRTGDRDELRAPAARELGFETARDVRWRMVHEEASADGRSHLVELVLDDALTPAAWIFTAQKTRPGSAVSTIFRVDRDGALERALFKSANFEKGVSVASKGVKKTLDPKDAQTQKQLHYELDFWLKGLHRKPASAASPAKP